MCELQMLLRRSVATESEGCGVCINRMFLRYTVRVLSWVEMTAYGKSL